MLGCTGAILAAANLEPELCGEAFAGNVAAQKDLLDAHRITVVRLAPRPQGELHPRTARHRTAATSTLVRRCVRCFRRLGSLRSTIGARAPGAHCGALQTRAGRRARR